MLSDDLNQPISMMHTSEWLHLPGDLQTTIAKRIFAKDLPFFDKNICSIASVSKGWKGVTVLLLKENIKELDKKIVIIQKKMSELKSNVDRIHTFFEQAVDKMDIIPDENDQIILRQFYQFKKQITPFQNIQAEITDLNSKYKAKLSTLEKTASILPGCSVYWTKKHYLKHLVQKLNAIQDIFQKLPVKEAPKGLGLRSSD